MSHLEPQPCKKTDMQNRRKKKKKPHKSKAIYWYRISFSLFSRSFLLHQAVSIGAEPESERSSIPKAQDTALSLPSEDQRQGQVAGEPSGNLSKGQMREPSAPEPPLLGTLPSAAPASVLKAKGWKQPQCA